MRVTICDVGPRDGLQNEPETLPPATRAELVNRLAAAKLPRIEAASFVRAEAVPQMAGAEDVVRGIERRAGTEYSGLALNVKGYERLVASGLDRVNFTLAATDSFSRRNANQSVAEARAAAADVLQRSQLPVTITISVAFGCPFDASCGGLGGCPYAPRATGNIATEDLVYLFAGDGVDTGIDLDALIATSAWLEGVLGRRLEGQVYRAGAWAG